MNCENRKIGFVEIGASLIAFGILVYGIGIFINCITQTIPDTSYVILLGILFMIIGGSLSCVGIIKHEL